MRRTLAAIAFGLLLASLPFVRYRFASPHPTAHGDHAPRHGGELVMAGDVHLELVRGEGAVELWVTDAYRRPVADVMASVGTGTAAPVAFRREGERLRAVTEDPRGRLRVTVRLPDGAEAVATFAATETP